MPRKIKDPKLFCTLCNQGCKQVWGLTQHIQAKHSDLKLDSSSISNSVNDDNISSWPPPSTDDNEFTPSSETNEDNILVHSTDEDIFAYNMNDDDNDDILAYNTDNDDNYDDKSQSSTMDLDSEKTTEDLEDITWELVDDNTRDSDSE